MFGLMEVHIFMSTGLNWNNTIKFINVYKLINKIFWNRRTTEKLYNPITKRQRRGIEKNPLLQLQPAGP